MGSSFARLATTDSRNARATAGQRRARHAPRQPATTGKPGDTAVRGFALGTLAAAAVAVAAAPALAAPGDLDPAFGSGGIRLFGSQTVGMDVAKAMLVQPDGKLVIAGSDGTQDFLVHRLHADGSPDRSFGGNGTVTADFAGRDDTITAIALQDDGKLVVAGRSAVGLDERPAVARLTAGGALDPLFGVGGDDGDGRVTLGAGAATDLQAVAVLPGVPRIRFTLSEAAHVSVTLKRRHGRSTRVDLNAVAGANRIRGARRLVRGRYRLTVVAVDPAGNAAPPARLRFKVKAR